ncbi:peptidoglycan-binding protein [Streptomyces sp. STR69]|uniref:peptidoglycan-binding protein n=1 Tax=Streptomyces sp. STR69 TaxID=1796942 RepID=UPI0021C757C5|nr:peptidoglycan-binding protein [Streptomyces sp. STR69]
MPELWMPGATRLDIGDHAATDGGPAKAIPHITWDENGTAARPLPLVPYETLVAYFGKNAFGRTVAPHILWDPFTGRYTQFVPATSRSKSLADKAGGTRTNRAGSVVLQIEALFFPYCEVGGKVYAKLKDTPCKGWAELHAWVKSWGVADAWPNGRPENCIRNEKTWETKSGWYPHKAVPENDHSDPLSWPEFPTAPAQPPTKPTYEPFPGEAWFKKAPRSAIVTAMGKRLVAEGCSAYTDGPGPQWTAADKASYAKWQRKLGYTGTAADGWPGATSWAALKVPNV